MLTHFDFFKVFYRLFSAKCKQQNISKALIILQFTIFLNCCVILFDSEIIVIKDALFNFLKKVLKSS